MERKRNMTALDMWWAGGLRPPVRLKPERSGPVLGVALSGGFALAVAHLGVLRVLEEHGVPINMIGGVSAGAIVAAAYASGREVEDIARAVCATKFSDLTSWPLRLLGQSDGERLDTFLRRLLKVHCFEDMRLPLAIVATDLGSGRPVVFHAKGDVILPLRASCAYPGVFKPVRYGDGFLVDGGVSMRVPARPLRQMGATRVVSSAVRSSLNSSFIPRDLLRLAIPCLQTMEMHADRNWRRHSSAVVEPDVHGFPWNRFDGAMQLVERGERAARAVLPRFLSWLEHGSGHVHVPELPAVRVA